MKKFVMTLLFAALFLSACSALPPARDDWADYMARIDRMDPAQLQATHSSLQQEYQGQPGDEVRLKLSYVMSRADPSLAELKRARQILAEVDASGRFATLRDMLDRQLLLSIRLQRAQGEILELKAQLEDLKKIETDLSRSSKEGARNQP